MRHRVRSRKLGRTSAHRKAMYRNMVTSLLDHERIQTTDAKAKEVRRLAERMITLGKRGSLHARRRALSVIRSREVTAKVFDELAERFRSRPGGYTRVVKLGPRRGDAAALSVVELVEELAPAAEAPKKGRKASKKAATSKAAGKKAATAKAAGKKTASRKTASKKTAGGKTGKATAKKATAGKTAGRTSRKKKAED
jgi:large subunit ribosomal protein L17